MNISVHTTYVYIDVFANVEYFFTIYQISQVYNTVICEVKSNYMNGFKWYPQTWYCLNIQWDYFFVWFIPQYVFINNVSFRSFFQTWFSFSIISHKLFTSISKEIYCGHINHRKLFQCCFMIDDKEVKESRFACSWFAVWAWWMLSFSYFQKMWIALTLYSIWRVLQIWTVVISLNDHINHRKSIAYIGIYVKLLFVIRFITYYIHVLL